MAEFLSDEWFESFSASAAAAAVDPCVRVAIEQVVTGEAGRVWTVAVADGRVVVTPGASPDPTVRLSTDRATAEGIHNGTISGPRAFLDGRLRIGGDWSPLMADRESLAAIAALRPRPRPTI